MRSGSNGHTNQPNRAKNLIAWVLANQDRINQANKLQLTVNCAGDRFYIEIKECHEFKADPSLKTA